ncbi:MAG: glutamyl-tRNA reductase [Sedimentisphaerales bacterium]|nr:glutamyl-tRNA reductase [Sedimentisphaerales bacterium]
MKIAVVGLNHKTASVDIREQLAFSAEQAVKVLGLLKAKYPGTGFVLLSTCNRTELYYAGGEQDDSLLQSRGGSSTDSRNCPTHQEMVEFLSDYCSVPMTTLQENFYIYHDAEAVEHLLSVAASLDSLVIGEAQILAQVKESYALASGARATNKVINRLFHCAFATSKEVYSLTSIAQRRVSVAGVAIELAGQLFENIRKAKIAVIGAGEMGELLVRHLLDVGGENITVFNRTLKRAESMARKYAIAWGDWQALSDYFLEADIVIAAALAEEHLFDKSCLSGRSGGALLIIDIAVPRNFDASVNELEEVFLYSVDDLEQVAQKNLAIRQEDVGRAREIIADNVKSFMDWFGVKDIGPLIGRLRDKFQQFGQAELLCFLAGENNMEPGQRQKMEAAVNRITNRMLHRLINALYTIAQNDGADEARYLIESIIQDQQQPDNQECQHGQ